MSFTTKPLTHSLLDDVTSVNFLVLVYLLNKDENLVLSTDLPWEAATHQHTIWVGGPGGSSVSRGPSVEWNNLTGFLHSRHVTAPHSSS
jgi:hypothetical protein